MMIKHWIIGLLGAFLLTWIAGRSLVDSILVRVADPVLQAITLRPDDQIAWRSEGWGLTLVGPHGLPGWQPRDTDLRVALWGDSQVEGVCVDDVDKIHRQVITLAAQVAGIDCDCLPVGRSGTDARDWRQRMPIVQAVFQPRCHVWLITDLDDLTALADPAPLPPAGPWARESPAWVRVLAELRGEALFSGAKRLLLNPDTGGLRSLDFSLGPRTAPAPNAETTANSPGVGDGEPRLDMVTSQVAEVATSFGESLILVYAPATPRIHNGWQGSHPDDERFETLRDAISARGIEVLDLRPDFLELWNGERKLPRGFPNGTPGLGHLNRDGNRIVASRIAAALSSRLLLAPSTAEPISLGNPR